MGEVGPVVLEGGALPCLDGEPGSTLEGLRPSGWDQTSV